MPNPSPRKTKPNPKVVAERRLLLLRRLLDKSARWEPFPSGDFGEICVNGLRYSTHLDPEGIPEIHDVVFAALTKEPPRHAR